MGVEAWETRSLSIAMSQNPKIMMEKGKLEQGQAEKGPCRGRAALLLESMSQLWSLETAQHRAVQAQDEPRRGQEQQSGTGTKQDPASAPAHFQKDLGEWTVHDNAFAWEVKKQLQSRENLSAKKTTVSVPTTPQGWGFPFLSIWSLSVSFLFYSFT